MREHADERIALVGGEAGELLRRDCHSQLLHLHLTGEAFGRLRMAVGIGNIGLDVKNRRPVHEVCPCDVEHRPARISEINALEPHARQADGVRPERGARGEHAHAHIAAQSRRSHGRRPGSINVFGKLPDQPDVRVAVQPPHSLTAAEFRLKDDLGLQAFDDAALTWDAEFGGKITVDVCDRSHSSISSAV